MAVSRIVGLRSADDDTILPEETARAHEPAGAGTRGTATATAETGTTTDDKQTDKAVNKEAANMVLYNINVKV